MPLPLLIPLLASTAGQVAGTVMSAIGNQKRQRQLDLRQRRLDQWYNSEYNKDYLDNIESKSALKTVMDNLKRQGKSADNTAAIMGASDESKIANKEQQNRTYADFVNNLAAKGQARRDNVQADYMNQKNNLDQHQDALTEAKQQTYNNIASNAGNILDTASAASSIGALDSNAKSQPVASYGSLASDITNKDGSLKPTNKMRIWDEIRANDNPNTIKNNGRAIPLLKQ